MSEGRGTLLISAFGTSTPFAYWGFSAVVEVAKFLVGDEIHRIHCLALEDFKQGLEARDGRSVVFTSDIPDPAITEWLIKNDLPVIAFFDDLAESVAYAMESRSMAMREALSFSTRTFCALGLATRSRNVLIFREADVQSDIRDVLARILTHLGEPADDDRLEALMSRAITGYTPGSACTVAAHIGRSTHSFTLPQATFAALSLAEQVITTRVCAEYRPLFEGRALTRIEWPREVFFTSNIGGETTDLIALAGRARILIYGPYLYIPVGQWIARVEFEVVENLSGNHLAVDVSKAGAVLAESVAALPVTGVFACELAFSTEDIATPVEVRLRMVKGAIEGRMSLKSVVIRAGAAVVAQAPAQVGERQPEQIGTARAS